MKSFAKFLFLLALTQGESQKKSYRMFLKKKEKLTCFLVFTSSMC